MISEIKAACLSSQGKCRHARILKNWKQRHCSPAIAGQLLFFLDEEMALLTQCLFQDSESAKYYKVIEMDMRSHGVSSSQMKADTLNIKKFGYTKKWVSQSYRETDFSGTKATRLGDSFRNTIYQTKLTDTDCICQFFVWLNHFW